MDRHWQNVEPYIQLRPGAPPIWLPLGILATHLYKIFSASFMALTTLYSVTRWPGIWIIGKLRYNNSHQQFGDHREWAYRSSGLNR